MGNQNSASLRVVGDPDARFAVIYQDYFRHVYAYCRRRTDADRVDDAVADVFLIAWRRIASVPFGDRALPWLYGVAFKVLGQQWRGASRKKKLEKRLTSVGLQPVAGTEDVILQNELTKQVMDALDQLKPMDQEILRLSIWEDLPHSDVADILELTEDATKQRLSRARKRFTREFNRLHYGIPPLPGKEVHGDH